MGCERVSTPSGEAIVCSRTYAKAPGPVVCPFRCGWVAAAGFTSADLSEHLAESHGYARG